VRRVSVFVLILLCGLAAFLSHGETFRLANGKEITGEMLLSSANDQGVQIKVGEGDYQRVPWANFSQEDLKRLSQAPKLQPLVEPFIEISLQDRLKKTEVDIKPPPRLHRPEPRSLLGAMFGSPLGLFLLLSLYAATIYAGFEVAIFRAQRPLLVAGLAAIPFIGILSPIVFLSLPTRLKSGEPETESLPAEVPAAAAAAAPAAAAASDDDNPMHADGVVHPAGLKLAHEEKQAGPAIPQTIVYQRGQFTFNRRFIETKFANFFGVVRRDADKDLLLVIKSSRGEYLGERISRIAANDLHLQVRRGHATEEVMVPFIEIQEIRVQHKDAKK
jgi:hypothetical protein